MQIVKYLIEDKGFKPRNLNIPGILSDEGLSFDPKIVVYLI